MKAAVVTGPNQTPSYADFDEPSPRPGHELIEVGASALSHAARSRAAGDHYSSSDDYPLVVGIDGVGRTADGRRVGFVLPEAPFGAMAQRTLVAAERCVEVPEGVDDVLAAALLNSGLSSAAALRSRAGLAAGETVLVDGATGSAGSLAVQLAKHLGAGTVIATGRDAAALERMRGLGADITVDYTDDDAGEQLAQLFAGQGVDVVLEYLHGLRSETLLGALGRAARRVTRPVRYVIVGGSRLPEVTVSAVLLRAAPVVVMGSGIGSVPMPDMMDAIRETYRAAGTTGLQIATREADLADVSQAWADETGTPRLVFRIGTPA